MLAPSTFLRLAPALLALVLAACPMSQTLAGPVGNGIAEDMLQDGRDANDNGRPDIAQKIFETLRATYPGTAEADAAGKELSQLPAGTAPAHLDAAPARREAMRPAARPQPPRFISAKERDDTLRRLGMHFLTEVGDRVFFAENSAAIGGRARAVIEAQARWLKNTPSIEVTVIGRADDGTTGDDATLISNERAKAVEAMLVGNGVAPSRIRIEARGTSDPIAVCTSPLCQAQNRHAESLLRYPDTGGRLSDGEGGAGTGRGADAGSLGTSVRSLAR